MKPIQLRILNFVKEDPVRTELTPPVHRSQTKKLSDIQEDVLEQTDSERARPRLQTKSVTPTKLTPLVNSRPPSELLRTVTTFVHKLAEHKPAFSLFFNEALRKQLVVPSVLKARLRQPQAVKASRSVGRMNKSPILVRRTVTPVRPQVPKLNVEAFKQPRLTESLLTQFNELHPPQLSQSALTRSHRSLLSATPSRLWQHGQRRPHIERNNRKRQKRFMQICKHSNLTKCRLDSSMFQEFLNERYPEHVSSTLSKYLVFNSATYEDFIEEMERMLKLSDRMQLRVCFEAYDFNRDERLTFEDTYALITQSKSNCLDSDLFKISHFFDLKREGNLPRPRLRFRERSMASLYVKEADSKPKVPAKDLPVRREALVFEEFCQIDFDLRPQLLKDLFAYTCCFDILPTLGKPSTPVEVPKDYAEFLVKSVGMNQEERARKLKYFLELEELKKEVEPSLLSDLERKFSLLADSKTQMIPVITLDSFCKKCSQVFPPPVDYLSKKLYEFFSDTNTQPVNRVQFVRKAQHMLRFNRVEDCKFAFDLYDQRQDGVLSVNEVYSLYKALAPETPAHQECQQLVEKYISNIFSSSPTRKALTFNEFLHEVDRSELTKVFVDSLRTPMGPILLNSIGKLGRIKLMVRSVHTLLAKKKENPPSL